MIKLNENNKWTCLECNSNKKSSLKDICLKCYYKKNKEKIKLQSKNWTRENYVRHKELVMDSKKKNNYYYEKNPEERKLRIIKRKTRIYFPLAGKNCEFCGNIATEHHHNTRPIEINKFNYICHSCHNLNSNRRNKNGNWILG